MRKLRKLLVFTLTIAWLFSGQFQIWHSPLIPPRIKEVKADTTNLMVTSCDDEDVNSPTCYTAISADGGTSYAFTKNLHLDAPFQTLSASAVSSATLYYDSWATLSGSWAIYVKDARDGNIICSVDPAPEDGSETPNSLDCSSVTTTQLSNGIWFQADNNDGAGPQDVNLDYVRFYVDYTPPPVISIVITTDGTIAYGPVEGGQSKSTIDLTDTQTAQNDGSATENFNIMTSNAVNGTSWMIGSSAGNNVFVHEFSTNSGGDWTKFTAADSYQTLATGVEVSGTVDFDLRITVPTDSDSTQKNITITVQAVAP